ncbi:MAG: glycosyltransferase [Bifidobacterium crudilactis]|nr:glycosyltransferase [Bifidobacterium crudilactis]
MTAVSVVVPVYNVEQYLEECIESVITQDYEDIELLLIDDGSTDGSGIICDKAADKDARVRVFHRKNAGVSDARNFGMKRVRGQFALFVDADDTLHSSAISASMETLASLELKADCLVFTYWLTDETGEHRYADFEARSFPQEGMVIGGQALEVLLMDRIQNYIWRVVFAVSIWESNNIAFPVGQIYEDVSVLYRILLGSRNVFFMDQRLYNYRQRSGSYMHRPSVCNVLQCRNAFIRRSHDVRTQIPGLFSLCRAQIYKAHYRVAVYMLRHGMARNQQEIDLLRESTNALKSEKFRGDILSIFSLKQKLTVLLLRYCPLNVLLWAIRLMHRRARLG